MVVAMESAAAAPPQSKRPSPSSNPKLTTTRRPPLLPSETDNNVTVHRRPKIREVTSRYLSSTPSSSSCSTSTSTSSSNSSGFGSRRFNSPINSRGVGSGTVSTTLMRSPWVEKRRPGTPRETMSEAARMLVSSSSSRRSLSVSFQGESFSMRVNKVKHQTAAAAPMSSSARKGVTPERRRAGTTTTTTTPRKKDGDQGECRWPAAMSRLMSSGGLLSSKSVDLGSDRKKLSSSEGCCRTPLLADGKTRKNLTSTVLEKESRDDGVVDSNLVNVSAALERIASDEESVSSESNARDRECVSKGRGVDRDNGCVVEGRSRDRDNGMAAEGSVGNRDSESVVQGRVEDRDNRIVAPGRVVDRGTRNVAEGRDGDGDNGNVAESRAGARVFVVPARFLQESSSRPRRVPEPGSPVSRSGLMKATAMPKLNVPKKFEVDTRAPSPSPRGSIISRGLSPFRGAIRTPSPSKLGSSSEKGSLRALASPIRVRNAISGALSNNVNITSSVLSFAADIRRGKVGENGIDDAHYLRTLYNRQLQWRFCNARAEAALLNQSLEAEKSLYNAWKATSELRGAVSAKRKELQWMRQKLKLTSILDGQILYLEEWQVIEMDHSSSLSGAIESLKASIVRLPLICGARADIQNVKDAICSSLDVMQSMASSICSMLPKVEEMNVFVGNVAYMSSKERVLLDECKDILSTLAAMQVKDCSLRTHTLQLERAQPSLAV